MQRTLREKASCTGVGLHSGKRISLEVFPAPEDHGITFVRTDLPPHAELRASVEAVADTRLATTLAAGVNGSRVVVGTVEHLLAALAGCGVDNARVHIDGPEVPVLDGSAAPFVTMLQAAGFESQRRPRRFLVVRKEVKVTDGDKEAKVVPGTGLQITCSVDFDHPLIPPTPFKWTYSERSFAKDIAPARTFGFLKDVEALRRAGLALGGSLENAIVIDHYRVLNPEGLRFPDEFVRHKALDAIGDVSLLGMPIVGKLVLHRSGHQLNAELVRAVLADARNYEIVVPSRGEASERAALSVLETAESVA